MGTHTNLSCSSMKSLSDRPEASERTEFLTFPPSHQKTSSLPETTARRSPLEAALIPLTLPFVLAKRRASYPFGTNAYGIGCRFWALQNTKKIKQKQIKTFIFFF